MRALTVTMLALAATVAIAATPAQEKQFVETYKKASEGKDTKTLAGMLYTKGAEPQAVEFYKMMLGAEAGAKIASIELVDLTAEDRANADNAKSPAGKPMKLVLPATKKLVIKSGTQDKNGSSNSTSQMFVGEADGRLWILLPAAAK